MNFYKDIKNKNPLLEKKLSFKKIRYRIINDKYHKLNNDFKILIGENKNDNKKKKISIKNRYSIDMHKYIKNLFSKSAKNENDIIKKLNINYLQKNFKRVLSSQEINIVKNSKIKFHNIFKYKNNINIIENKTYHSRNPINTINNITNASISNNNLIDNKIMNSTKSIGNILLKYDDNKNTKNKEDIKFLKKFNFRKKLLRNKNSNSFKTSIEKQTTNINSNLNNISSNEINNKEYYIKNKNSTNKNISISNIDDNNNVFDTHISKYIKYIYKKINLKKLKISIDKFENSRNYIHDGDIIQQNSIDPLYFLSRKYMKQYEINNFYKQNKNKVKSTKDKKITLRRIFSAQKISHKLSRNVIPLKKDNSPSKSKSNDSTKNILNKINNIKKTIQIKNNMLKIKKSNMINVNNINNYFTYDASKEIDKVIIKNLKIDVSDYHKKIGHFIYQNGKNMFSSHISFFLKGDNILKGLE